MIRKNEEQFSIESKEIEISNILSRLSKNPLLKQFSSLFLESMSIRLIHTFTTTEIIDFLTDRFHFFKKSICTKGRFQFCSSRESQNRAIELVYPEAQHLLITLEALFRKKDIRVTCRLHPIIAVAFDKKGNLKEILAPSEDKEMYSTMFIEFEDEEESIIQALLPDISFHMNAVQACYKSQTSIFEQLRYVKNQIKSQSFKLNEPKEEWLNLIDWLKNSNFSFFGYCSYQIEENANEKKFLLQKENSLGILSQTALGNENVELLESIEAHIWSMRNYPFSFLLDQTKTTSLVQRFDPLMRLSLRIKNEKQELIEHNFVGLLKRSSLQVRNLETPLIHLKIKYIFEYRKMIQGNYDYNEVIRIFNSTPKYELFRSSSQELLQIVEDLFSITNPTKIHCYCYRTIGKNNIHIMIVIPTSLFLVENIQAIDIFMKEEVPHLDCEKIEIRREENSRLHFYFDLQTHTEWLPNLEELELKITELVQSWKEKLKYLIYQKYSTGFGNQIMKLYLDALPKHYSVRTTPEDAMDDIIHLEKLAHADSIEFNLKPFVVPNSSIGDEPKCLLYVYSKEKIDLIRMMPILENMGLFVFDQLTTKVGINGNKPYGFIQSFRVTGMNNLLLDIKIDKALLGNLLIEVFNGRTANDPLNSLAVKAKLDWRAINVIQCYRNLYLQMFPQVTREKLNSILVSYVEVTKTLFLYFKTKFCNSTKFGDIEYRNSVLLPKLEQQFFDTLSSVNAVESDGIFHKLFCLFQNTLRTNFYIPKTNDDTFISILIDSQKIDGLSLPVPFREIYVYDSQMEGVHLRFGSVARGGLRWSDRLHDFRTEVLCLAKTQQIKNVVIVPVGSKGGFIIKKDFEDRKDAIKESKIQYRKFIRALLDITDNYNAEGKVIHPCHVKFYNESDPYLVVAADKGTATFSDIANEISQQYHFWLGDAFASGGSVGYDHKKQGITAKGAWECVKLHFKESGMDIDQETFDVIGIGDMSGDVFGNGMLLSKNIKLKVAFNHIHIFLDPNPVPETSWKERKRLFEMPRSTWKEYSHQLISKGGGVFERKAKKIKLSPEVQEMLGIKNHALNGEQLIQKILEMKTDLLWFGGIGTYIKSKTQSHSQVGDHANDTVRIDVENCKAKIIGEGANLGLTQTARIIFDQMKGRMNSDAIDNSAGVNMSDYEVNIKILLEKMLVQKNIKHFEERNQILANATEEVTQLVLKNNQDQHRLISMDKIRSRNNFKLFQGLISYLVKQGRLNPRSEHIPTEKELEHFEKTGLMLPRSILGILQAYVKMEVYETLLSSPIIEGKEFDKVFIQYFPKSIQKKFGASLLEHPLKKEIISTCLTNQVVNQSGITFLFRCKLLTGKNIDHIIKTYFIFNLSLEGDAFRNKILALNQVSEEAKYLAIIEFQNLLKLLTIHMIETKTEFQKIQEFHHLLDAFKNELKVLKNVMHSTKKWEKLGYSKGIAMEIAVIEHAKIAPDVIYLAEEEQLSVKDAFIFVCKMNEIFEFEWLKNHTQKIIVHNDWELHQQDFLLQQISLYKKMITKYCLNIYKNQDFNTLTKDQFLASNCQEFKTPLQIYFDTLHDLKKTPHLDLINLGVGIQKLRFIEKP